MPILNLLGTPEGVDGLRVLATKLQQSVEAFPDFELTRQQVSVFYPVDRMQEGLGEELILMIDGFFSKPARTPQLRDAWSATLCGILQEFATEHVPHCTKIEVILRVFDPNFNGFAQWEKVKAE
ncbi:MAG: hypothetical protein ABIP54_00980 [Candidatus Andersenbacteria bacterium]